LPEAAARKTLPLGSSNSMRGSSKAAAPSTPFAEMAPEKQLSTIATLVCA
jgi:hypothetical protein